jgi:hypothetical protein
MHFNFKVLMLLNSERDQACALDMQLMEATEMQDDCSAVLRMAIDNVCTERTKSATAGDCIFTCYKTALT